jgi:hypothetical protein
MYTLSVRKSCKDGTFGFLFKDKIPFCITLEPEKSIIPAGVYTCVRYGPNHPINSGEPFNGKHPYDVFLIKNILGHEYVEIHIANVKYDTDGCLGIGMGITTFNNNIIEHIPESDGNIKGLSFSGVAFNALMTTEKNSFQLTVE